MLQPLGVAVVVLSIEVVINVVVAALGQSARPELEGRRGSVEVLIKNSNFRPWFSRKETNV